MNKTQILSALSLSALLFAFSAPSQGESLGFHSTLKDNTLVVAGEQTLRVRHNGNPAGTLALVSNRSGQTLHIQNGTGMVSTVHMEDTMSWGCTDDTFTTTLVIETTEGDFIASPTMACGDAVYVIAEEEDHDH